MTSGIEAVVAVEKLANVLSATTSVCVVLTTDCLFSVVVTASDSIVL